MWVSSMSPSSLSLIGSLTTEIYYRTGVTGNTDRLGITWTWPGRVLGPVSHNLVVGRDVKHRIQSIIQSYVCLFIYFAVTDLPSIA